MKEKKNRFKKVILVLLVMFLLTGCTKNLKNENNQAVTNPETGQSLTANILCLPEDETLLNIYKENKDRLGVNLDSLDICSNMHVGAGDNYDGLWSQIFVRPLAWLIIKLGLLVNNYGISVMLIGLIIRLILLPFTITSTKQNEKMKEMQPALAKLEKKYENKTDAESQSRKAQETLVLYQKYKINPMTSCLVSFIQLPLFFAFLEAINRTPAIFENYLGPFQLGTTPIFGLTHGNYWYILLVVLIMVFTILSFITSMSSMSGNSNQQKQTQMMMIMMIVFIGIASLQLPSAIALYWVVTNAFSVVQTYIVRKVGSK